MSAAAAAWFHSNQYTLYYGDAEAHLNIARRLSDSRTPNYEQVGTAWLPLPHLLMAPLAARDPWWHSGLAGALPAAACFAASGVFLFAAARRLFGVAAGFTALLAAALNPNLLYLQSIPMTEPLFLAALMAMLYWLVRLGESKKPWPAAAAGVALLLATLTRYEGWFLIPFATLLAARLARKRRGWAAFLFAAPATLGPLYWLGHNWWCYGDALEFYRGFYSAKAIYERSLAQGMQRYAGDGDWAMAWLYFRTAVQWCAGWGLIVAAGLGAAACAWKRVLWPLGLLALPPLFYLWSMHSGDTPIYVPNLWPNAYFNTRYGVSALPLLALAAAGVVAASPERWRAAAAAVVVLTSSAGWIAYPRMESWICWKESQVNSEARRVWTREAAVYLRAHYRGGGILTSFGDLTGIFREAGIPLRETLHEGNEPYWQGAVARPDLMLWEEWVVAISGDKVSSAVFKTRKSGPRYGLVKSIAVKGAPVIEIYRRRAPVVD